LDDSLFSFAAKPTSSVATSSPASKKDAGISDTFDFASYIAKNKASSGSADLFAPDD